MYSLLLFLSTLLCFAFLNVFADQLTGSSANLSTLVHLHVLWRHGDRNPWILLPNDIENGLETWQEGLGELTRLGIEQEFHLGQLIRHRYSSYLPIEYSAKEFYVRSSDRNRTLMSAQAVLAGLFPRVGVNLTDQLNPMPVHSVPFEEDRILNDMIFCPAAIEEEANVYNSPAYKGMEQKYSNLLGLMGQESGFGDVPLKFRDIWKVYDSLYAEFLHPDKHKLPSWVDRTILWQMSQAFEQSAYGLYDSDLLKRLRAGPIMGDIVNRIQQKIDSKPGVVDQKMHAYSGHDTTIASVLVGLGIKPRVFPLYSTALMLELHRDLADNSYYLRLFYRNNTQSDDVYELDIPDCPQPCSFDLISRRLKATLIPADWEADCNLIRTDANSFPYLFFIFVLVSVAVILACAIVFLQFYQISNAGSTSFSTDKP